MECAYRLDFGDIEIKPKAVKPSSKNEYQNEISFSKSIYEKSEEKVNEIMHVKFNVEVRKHKTLIHDIVYLSNSNVTKIDYILAPSHISKPVNTLMKVGAFVMPMGPPAVIQTYADEMRDVVDKPVLKTVLAVVFAVITRLMGVDLFWLATGLLFIAIIEMLLSMIPGNIKVGTEKDHTIQVKFYGFITNFLGLVIVVKGMTFLKDFTGDNQITGIVSTALPYIVAGWIYSIYFKRTVGYIARANKTKLPKKVRDMFGKEEIGG